MKMTHERREAIEATLKVVLPDSPRVIVDPYSRYVLVHVDVVNANAGAAGNVLDLVEGVTDEYGMGSVRLYRAIPNVVGKDGRGNITRLTYGVGY